MAKITANEIKESAQHAVFWAGILAIILAATSGNWDIPLFALAVAAIDVALTSLLPARKGTAQKQQEEGTISFRITPLHYPKILDSDINDYAPEFLRLDIINNGSSVFSGNLARDTYKSLRNMVDMALAKQQPMPATTGAPKPNPPAMSASPAAKKGRKK